MRDTESGKASGLPCVADRELGGMPGEGDAGGKIKREKLFLSVHSFRGSEQGTKLVGGGGGEQVIRERQGERRMTKNKQTNKKMRKDAKTVWGGREDIKSERG